MASTDAVLYLKPQASAGALPLRATGAVLFVPFRGVSGLFSSATASTERVKNLKSWKPSANAPMVDKDGCITPPWNRFFDYLIETVLGGANAPTLPQVGQAAVYSATQAQISSAIVGAVAQQAAANAQALQAVVEVAKFSAIPGASQIPPVQLAAADVPDAVDLTDITIRLGNSKTF